MKDYKQWVQDQFREKFGQEGTLVRSPGRINLIGEHTDYNKGWVFPAAIRQSIYLAIHPNSATHFQIEAFDLQESVQIPIDGEIEDERPWVRFLAGMIREFGEFHTLVKGFNIGFGGDLPMSSGLSFSAALAVGLGWGLQHAHKGAERKRTLMEIARMAWFTEKTHFGIECGFMDQYAVCFGMEGMGLHLDCRNMEAEYVPLHLGEYSLVLFDSGIKNNLAESAYNDRQKTCEEVVRSFRARDYLVHSLRDLRESDLEIARGWLNEEAVNTARFVVRENDRVQLFRNALNAGQLEVMGALLTATHKGLSEEYRVSCAELDFLVEKAVQLDGVSGSRMMGGGFGGCTLNLIQKDLVQQAHTQLADLYQKSFSLPLRCIEVEIGNGVEILND